MLNFNFRKPKIADNFKRNRYDISNPDTLAHEGYKIIVLDEGELAVDANQQPIDAGYTVSEEHINSLVNAINLELSDIVSQIAAVQGALSSKYGADNPPAILNAKAEEFVSTVYDNTSDNAGAVRIILKSSQYPNGVGYIKYKYNIRSGTTLYSDCVSELALIKLTDKVTVANLTSQGNLLKATVPGIGNEVDIEKNGAMFWEWKGIIEQKFIHFNF